MYQFNNKQPSRLIDYERLKREVSIESVLALLEFRPVSVKGPQLRGPCPVHKSSSPTSRIFSVNLDRGIYKCFKCDASGNVLDLCRETFGMELFAAAEELCHRLGIEVPRKP